MILNVGLTYMILFFKNYLFIVFHIPAQAHECHTWYPCGGQRAAFGNALCAQWAPVLKFRSSGLLRSASAL